MDTRRTLLIGVLTLALIHGTLYLSIVPPWDHYDEPTHFEYGWLIADRLRLPKAGETDQALQREIAASMLEQGFQDYPEQEFVMLRDRLWRALRIQLDVELHCRGLTVEAAAARMQQALGMSREHALADLTWYTRYPGVPMGYATGWTLINRLRDAVQAEQGDAFTLRAFHDRLLASGSLALPLAIRRGFGDATWAVVERQTFPRRAA